MTSMLGFTGLGAAMESWQYFEHKQNKHSGWDPHYQKYIENGIPKAIPRAF